jgi:hypothetical protein
MKKQAMSLAVTAALLGGAVSATGQSMYIDEGGLGEVLIYPFYSAANGNDTYVQVVNTTSNTKAVKVRIVEGQNSQEVLDFNLYLSPYDEWAAVITASDVLGGGAIIRTVDNSCTVPQLGVQQGGTNVVLPNGKTMRDQPFFTTLFDDEEPNDTAAKARTTEGYIELIEMGQLDPDTGLGADAVHGADGVPLDCTKLVDAWVKLPAPGGLWTASNGQAQLLSSAAVGESWAGGGLYGYSVLINVDEGTAVGVDATAIDSFASTALPPALHTEPGSQAPSLESGTVNSTLFIDGVSVPLTMANGLDAFSSLFMTDALINDYVIDPDIDALTDWIVTFPTKKDYDGDDPFTTAWTGPETRACEIVEVALWDREEAFEPPPSEGPVFSPAPPGVPPDTFSLCTEVNVLTFGDGSAVEASELIRYGLPLVEYTEGWAVLSLINTGSSELVGSETLTGLPALGFAVFEYTNNFLDGGTVKANYEAAVDHKTIEVLETP